MLGEWLQRPHIAGCWGACRSVCLGRGLGTAMVGEFVQFLWRDPAVTRIQADPAPTNARAIRCYEKGGVKLSADADGKEAVVAILGTGDFFGEGCLIGQTVRMATAISIAPTSILFIDKKEMISSSTG
jgi:CRP-like cAMP-binding protein